jgi:type I site-specific restriction-modification system R (restriction) subunit
MQAIARVNRVFRDKPAGLVVDYIGIAQSLKKAFGQYSASDAAETGIDEAQAVAVLLEKFDVVRAMFHGFDCAPGISGTPVARLKCLAEAIEFILARQHEAAAKETSDEARKAAHRRFQDAVLALTKAFALAAASDEAEGLSPEEIAFYDALADNESAVDIMGNDSLKVIAAELVNALRASATVDWSHRERARARMRVLVKRILRKYGFPPDLQDVAFQTVIQQAELLAERW